MTDEEFGNYEREFELALSTIDKKSNLITTQSGEKRKEVIREGEDAIETAKEILGNMRDASRSRKGAYDNKIKNYDREFQRIVSNFNSSRDTSGFVRTGNQGAMSFQEELESKEYDQKTRLLVGSERLQGARERLNDTRRLAHETEELGVDTLVDMKKQREQLEKARDRLDEVDSNVTRARQVLAAMSRRVVTNKLILLFIILILTAAIAIVVYFKWIRKTSPPTPSVAPTHVPSLPPAGFF